MEKSCPACSARMIDSPNAPGAWGCPSCGGVWAGIGVANRFVSTLDPAVKELAHLSERAAGEGRPRFLQHRACPDCRCWLASRVVRDITLDVCTNHGTWFDRGELAAINGERQPDSIPPSSGPPSSGVGDVAIGALGVLFAFLDD